jgi:hypothetical protein
MSTSSSHATHQKIEANRAAGRLCQYGSTCTTRAVVRVVMQKDSAWHRAHGATPETGQFCRRHANPDHWHAAGYAIVSSERF